MRKRLELYLIIMILLISVTSTTSEAGQGGFLYANGSFTTINVPGATGGTYGGGIDNSGNMIVGNYIDGTGSHGFLYANGSFTTIDVPGDPNNTSARGINDSGEIVGYFTNVPESATMLLLCCSLIGLGGLRRRFNT